VCVGGVLLPQPFSDIHLLCLGPIRGCKYRLRSVGNLLDVPSKAYARRPRVRRFGPDRTDRIPPLRLTALTNGQNETLQIIAVRNSSSNTCSAVLSRG